MEHQKRAVIVEVPADWTEKDLNDAVRRGLMTEAAFRWKKRQGHFSNMRPKDAEREPVPDEVWDSVRVLEVQDPAR